MAKHPGYSDGSGNKVVVIVNNLDRDIEKGEDIVMLGYGLALMAPLFAPILPPSVLLPLMAIVFAVCATTARLHFNQMSIRMSTALADLEHMQLRQLQPIYEVFEKHPEQTLGMAFNPLKNLKRTLRSVAGGLLINPFWGPILYMLSLQNCEDKHFCTLNKALIGVERKVCPHLYDFNRQDDRQ